MVGLYVYSMVGLYGINFGDSVSQSFEIEIVDRGENGVEVQCVPQQMLKTDNFPMQP